MHNATRKEHYKIKMLRCKTTKIIKLYQHTLQDTDFTKRLFHSKKNIIFKLNFV